MPPGASRQARSCRARTRRRVAELGFRSPRLEELREVEVGLGFPARPESRGAFSEPGRAHGLRVPAPGRVDGLCPADDPPADVGGKGRSVQPVSGRVRVPVGLVPRGGHIATRPEGDRHLRGGHPPGDAGWRARSTSSRRGSWRSSPPRRREEGGRKPREQSSSCGRARPRRRTGCRSSPPRGMAARVAGGACERSPGARRERLCGG